MHEAPIPDGCICTYESDPVELNPLGPPMRRARYREENPNCKAAHDMFDIVVRHLPSLARRP